MSDEIIERFADEWGYVELSHYPSGDWILRNHTDEYLFPGHDYANEGSPEGKRFSGDTPAEVISKASSEVFDNE